MTYVRSSDATYLDQVLDLLDLPRSHSGVYRPNDPVFEATRDKIIENLMGGCGFEDADSFRGAYDWAEDWIQEHPDVWKPYERDHPVWLTRCCLNPAKPTAPGL